MTMLGCHMTRHDIPGLPLRDPGSERADDSQEAVAGDGGEGHHAGHHAQHCTTLCIDTR